MRLKTLPMIVFLVPALLVFGRTAEASSFKWKFGKAEIARYRVVADNMAAKAGTSRLQVPGGISVRAADFTKDLVLNKPVEGFPELIFHYCLSAYQGSGKGTKVGRNFEKLMPYRLNMAAIGRVKSKKSGSKHQIEGLLQLGEGKGARTSYVVKTGLLKWVTLFDGKNGHVLSANYEFQLTYTIPTMKPPREYITAAKGRIVLIEKGKRSMEKFRKDVKVAIKKGAEWLKKRPSMGSSQMGPLALKLFALLRSGVSPDEKVIQQGFESLAKMAPKRTYGVSLYIMALEAKSVKRGDPEGASTVPRYQRGRIGKNDMRRIKALSEWLVRARNPGKGTWHYTSAAAAPENKGQALMRGGYDNSNTQFAVLALHAAQRAGVKISPVVWAEIFNHFRSVQCQTEGNGQHIITRTGEAKPPAGKKASSVARGNTRGRGQTQYRGWAYSSAGKAYGSMTNAGLSSIAIAADMLKDARRLNRKDEADFKRMINEGLFWNAKNFSVTKNPGSASSGWYFYYMYSLEKACEVLAVDAFDGRDWYVEGAEHLVTLQGAEGAWNNTPNDTALALLFLNRATLRTTVNILPKRAATGLGRGDANDRSTVLIEKAGGLISLQSLLQNLKDASRSERSKYRRWFKDGLEKLEDINQPLVMPGLIELYKERAHRSWAKKFLRKITGDSKLKSPEDFEKWHGTWFALDDAGVAHNYNAIELMRQTIGESKNRLLRKVAVLAAVRLRAVELSPEIAKLLDSRAEKTLASDCLSVFMNRKPKDAAEVDAWYAAEGEKTLKKQAPKRLVCKAARGDEAAQKQVKEGGKTYLETLVYLARDPAIGGRICDLLEAITKQSMKAEEWSAWFRDNKAKIGKNGQLPKPKKPSVVTPPGVNKPKLPQPNAPKPNPLNPKTPKPGAPKPGAPKKEPKRIPLPEPG